MKKIDKKKFIRKFFIIGLYRNKVLLFKSKVPTEYKINV